MNSSAVQCSTTKCSFRVRVRMITRLHAHVQTCVRMRNLMWKSSCKAMTHACCFFGILTWWWWWWWWWWWLLNEKPKQSRSMRQGPHKQGLCVVAYPTLYTAGIPFDTKHAYIHTRLCEYLFWYIYIVCTCPAPRRWHSTKDGTGFIHM
jgi:hypothetical protein